MWGTYNIDSVCVWGGGGGGAGDLHAVMARKRIQRVHEKHCES